MTKEMHADGRDLCGDLTVVCVCVRVSGVVVLAAGKVLIIGGGIANFTNVAATFKVGLSSTLHFNSLLWL